MYASYAIKQQKRQTCEEPFYFALFSKGFAALGDRGLMCRYTLIASAIFLFFFLYVH